MQYSLQHDSEELLAQVTLATNYYGPFYFTLKLLPLLKESARLAPARIVWNSSGLQALGKVNWEDLRCGPHWQDGGDGVSLVCSY